MILSYYILQNKPVILVKMAGIVNMNNIITIAEKIWAAPGYDPSLSTIADLRNAETIFAPAEISQFAEFIMANEKASKGELLILVTKPFETALSMIFESKIVSHQKTHIFSTEHAALSHLRLSESEFDQLYGPEATVIAIGENEPHKKSPNH